MILRRFYYPIRSYLNGRSIYPFSWITNFSSSDRLLIQYDFWIAVRDKWPLVSVSEINCHWEIEPAIPGLRIRCSAYSVYLVYWTKQSIWYESLDFAFLRHLFTSSYIIITLRRIYFHVLLNIMIYAVLYCVVIKILLTHKYRYNLKVWMSLFKCVLNFICS